MKNQPTNQVCLDGFRVFGFSFPFDPVPGDYRLGVNFLPKEPEKIKEPDLDLGKKREPRLTPCVFVGEEKTLLLGLVFFELESYYL